MLLPSFFALAFGARKSTLLGRVALFYLGLLLTLVPLGLAAGTLGSMLTTHRATIAFVGGILLIIIGILTMLGVSIPIPGLQSSGGSSPLAVVALGAVYGLAGACTGPLLGAVLTFAAVSGSPLYGALLLALFGAGMALPLALLAFFWDAAKITKRLRPRPVKLGPITTTVWGIVAGLLFIAMGLLFLFTDATGAMGGFLDATQQLELESSLWSWAQGIPDIVALIVLAVVVGLLAGWAVTRSEPADDAETD